MYVCLCVSVCVCVHVLSSICESLGLRIQNVVVCGGNETGAQ